uniref:Protein with SprT-like domain at the N terminus n=1 Tax=Heliothis virescens TaxID=7102 RepID=A0A2A4K604_HELVI
MNLGDPELELIDPTPNVHSLFLHFDKTFFWTKLASRAVVRWSKRMYSCAGVCSYEGRGGLCDIALSEPLLKLRPRKDLIETLLHEMIHAFLFVTNRDQDRDGHGPNFKAHMYRINQSAGLNISIYHSFHDEVELYQTHWWRCNGPCQTRRPHFGIVRRSMNRAPGPSDYWWTDHLRKCGGTFVKIKEPEKQQKTKGTKSTAKPNADITKYITNNIKTINNIPNTCGSNNPVKPVLKDSSNIKGSIKTKSNSSSTVVVSKKGVVFNPTVPKPPTQPIPVFTGSGNTMKTDTKHYTDNVTETVRSIWANKQIPTAINKKPAPVNSNSPVQKSKTEDTDTFKKPDSKIGIPNSKKPKTESPTSSPPIKMKKIEDYFNASTILKDLYGDDYKLTQPSNSTKLIAVNVKVDLVDCPICNAKFSNKEINRHLDECLNKDIIEKLSKDGIESVQEVQPSQSGVGTTINGLIDVKPVPAFVKPETTNNNLIDLTNFNVEATNTNKNKGKRKTIDPIASVDKVISSVKEIEDAQARHVIETVKITANADIPQVKRRKTDSHVTRERGDDLQTGINIDNKVPEDVKIKAEPGTSKEEVFDQICPCCGKQFDKPVEEHLDECLMFFDNNTTIPDEGASTSYENHTTIVIEDEDDIFDESQVLNATGTKTPCPCCMQMVEELDMNDHLDLCLK